MKQSRWWHVFTILYSMGLAVGCTDLLQPPDETEVNPVPSYDDVVLIVNSNSSISKEIGAYFVAARSIPPENICSVATSTNESMNHDDFDVFYTDVQACLQAPTLQSKKLNYLVTTKGVPLTYLHRDLVPPAPYSVDGRLVLILSDLTPGTPSGSVKSPYFEAYQPFDRTIEKYREMFLVTRLTGYDFEDVKLLIDQATSSFYNLPSHPSRSSDVALVDRECGSYSNGAGPDDGHFETPTINLLTAAGYNVVEGAKTAFILNLQNIMMGFSWGANDCLSTNLSHTWNYGFAPGAIMDTAVSYGGRTFNVEQRGGLVQLHNGGATSTKYPPKVKADLNKTTLRGLAKVGDFIFAGTADIKLYSSNFARTGSGIYVFDPAEGAWTNKKYTKENTDGELPDNFIYDLAYSSAHHRLFAATHDGIGVLNLNTEKWTAVDTGFIARTLLVDGNALWAATSVGVRRYDLSSGTLVAVYTKEGGFLPTNNIWGVTKSSSDARLFFGATGFGVVEFDGANWQTYSLGTGSRFNSPTTLLAYDDILWVGQFSSQLTDGNGQILPSQPLVKFDMDTNSVAASYELATNAKAMSLAIQDGSLLIGTYVTGMYKMDLQTEGITQVASGRLTSTFVGSILPDGQDTWLAQGRTGQTLVADLITMGVTGVQGYVNEPYLASVSRPHIRFKNYLSGKNLAESFYSATYNTNWMHVVVGDPKVAPFKGTGLPNLKFAYLNADFYDEDAYDYIHDFPMTITGRTSSLSGKGRWELSAIDAYTSVLLGQGAITSTKDFQVALPDDSKIMGLYDSNFKMRLEVFNESNSMVASDEHAVNYPKLMSSHITAPAMGATLNSADTIEIRGDSRFQYTIGYEFVGGDGTVYTDGVQLNNSGDAVSEADSLLGTLDLSQAVAHSASLKVLIIWVYGYPEPGVKVGRSTIVMVL